MILTLGLICIVADIWHLYRLHRRARKPRRGLWVWLIVTDSLPFILAVVSGVNKDNSSAQMSFDMWLIWAWLITVVPRLALYGFRLIRLPRVGIAVAVAIALFFAWGTLWGRTDLRSSQIEICSAQIGTAFDGFRIVQISDTHVGTLLNPRRELTRIVDQINALQPDVVVFTGDLVNIRSTELTPSIQQLLQRIEAPVYAVTGNHDVGTYIKDTVALSPAQSLRELLAHERQMGWIPLQDTTVYIRRGGDSISLSGIAFDPQLRERRHDRVLPIDNLESIYRGVPAELFNITAVHLPQLWDVVRATDYADLTLSGHVHAMQLKLFGYSPAAWLYERWSGRYEEAGKTLYINDGTGYVAYPMRLGAAPEITLITLKSCK